MQLSSLTWTLVFQTQQSDSTVSTTATPSLNLNCATHKISLLFIRTWETRNSTIQLWKPFIVAGTAHCSLCLSPSLFLSYYNLYVHACMRAIIHIFEASEQFWDNFSDLFFFPFRDFDRNKSEELRRNFVSLVIRRVVYL